MRKYKLRFGEEIYLVSFAGMFTFRRRALFTLPMVIPGSFFTFPFFVRLFKCSHVRLFICSKFIAKSGAIRNTKYLTFELFSRGELWVAV